MTETQVNVEYLATGANRQTALADWSSSGVLAFGADSNIALWAPSADEPVGISCLLSGHRDQVKAVKFLGATDENGNSLIVSGSDDTALKLWSISPDLRRAECLQTVQEHSSPVNCIAVLKSQSQAAASVVPPLLATGAADATIKIWSLVSNQLHLVQTIRPAPKFFPLALALSSLDQNDEVLVLAAAGTRDIIQVFVAAGGESAPDFQLQATLTGHEGWIRSLDFVRESAGNGSDTLLASASQDKYVRLWRFHQGTELPKLVADADPSSGAFLPGKSPSNKAHRLRSPGPSARDFSVTFEALLLGHEDWIYSAKWFVHAGGKAQLLTTSADNSLAMWEADPASGIWVSEVRLGEISREKGATTATGSIGGFWTGLWAPDGKSVVCLGRTGSWRRWLYDETSEAWRPAIAVGGHTRAVTGIAWSRDGSYLLSTSSDQTTRLHAPWKRAGHAKTWHEMARPQIHGYDLNCIDALGPNQFVSGADEKLMRVFSKPKAVAHLLSTLSGSDGSSTADTTTSAIDSSQYDAPDAANMPVLGLSNKAIDAVEDDANLEPDDPRERDSVDPATVVRKSALDIDHPPFEENLSRHTLWPEVEKLYGHGYELSCLAVSHDGKLVASACRASSVNHAVIRLFETEKWTEVRPPLTAHSLTVTRLRFSLDDRYLLSVGRDRQWAVFERSDEDALRYEPLQTNTKGHTRMILDAAWASLESVSAFATAGRDKKVKIWSAKPQEDHGAKMQFAQAGEIKPEASVTAVAFLDRLVAGGSLVLAVGTEAGKISLYLLSSDTLQVSRTIEIRSDLCLPSAVQQLAWRPTAEESDDGNGIEREDGDGELAIAGEDSSLRIYRLSQLGAAEPTSS